MVNEVCHPDAGRFTAGRIDEITNGELRIKKVELI
jgi:hypothetical protein